MTKILYNYSARYNDKAKVMSLNFGNNNINSLKAQSAYKDGSGMGGGGMYMKQKGKRKEDELDEDLFQYKEDEVENEITFGELEEQDIPRDNLFNKFVNWFRKGS